MKERPILFSAPMVRVLLDGTKSQTRRVVKPQPPTDAPLFRVGEFAPALIDRRGEMYPGADVFGAEWDDGSDGMWCLKCPYGAPGDRLWVREGFCPEYFDDSTVGYRADWTGTDLCEEPRWAPSIHMPRWASRITLEITEVRVQRLQDISDDDARAEGVTETEVAYERDVYPHDSFKRAYSALWDRINGPGAWSSNPWIWALTFRRVKP